MHIRDSDLHLKEPTLSTLHYWGSGFVMERFRVVLMFLSALCCGIPLRKMFVACLMRQVTHTSLFWCQKTCQIKDVTKKFEPHVLRFHAMFTRSCANDKHRNCVWATFHTQKENIKLSTHTWTHHPSKWHRKPIHVQRSLLHSVCSIKLHCVCVCVCPCGVKSVFLNMCHSSCSSFCIERSAHNRMRGFGFNSTAVNPEKAMSLLSCANANSPGLAPKHVFNPQYHDIQRRSRLVTV